MTPVQNEYNFVRFSGRGQQPLNYGTDSMGWKVGDGIWFLGC